MKNLAQHVMDIARNSVEAKARNVNVNFSLDKTGTTLAVIFSDDGCGMDAAMVKMVTDPFTTTRATRKVGLGLPLLKMSVEQTGGYLAIESEKGIGTKVTAVFNTAHIDCVPPGDLAGTIALLVSGNPGVMFRFVFSTGIASFNISTTEIMEVLGEASINQLKVVKFLKEMVTENLEAIRFKT